MDNIHLNPVFGDFLSRLDAIKKSEKPRETIHVSELAGSIYFAYEKMRNAVEYREQHLFRRSAIERLINRKIFVEDNLNNLGAEVVKELIKTRYLKNDTVPTTAIGDVDLAVQKYHALFREIKKSSEERTKKYLPAILVMAASEIENTLWPNQEEELFLNFVYNSFLKNIEAPIGTDQKFLIISAYFGVHRALWKSDLPTIEYYLFKNSPDWSSDHLSVADQAQTYIAFKDFLEEVRSSAVFAQIQRKIRRNIAPYEIIRNGIFKEKIREKMNTPKSFLVKIEEILSAEYAKNRSKTTRMITRSIIYIFLTKIILALIVEVPYEIFLVDKVNYLPLAINLCFPPAFMFLLGSLISKPTETNTQEVKARIKDIVYGEGEKLTYTIEESSGSISPFFAFLYLFTFLGSFTLVTYLLTILNFNIVSGLVFFVFFSAVSFFGYRVSQGAKELVLIEGKKTIREALFDFITFPFIKLGQWLSDKYSKINIFVLILDYLIEIPLKSSLALFEQWASFINRQKENMLDR